MINSFRLFLVALISASALGPASLSAVSTTIVISEFRVRGPSGGSDEFVELYNASPGPVNIGGWKLKGSNNAGTTSVRATVPLNVIVPRGCHYLFTNSSSSGGPYSGAVPGDQSYATGITDDGGLAITMGDDSIVDQAGMSTGSAFKEGTPLTPLGAFNQNRGYERRPGGSAGSSTDTDNNAGDFQLIAPSAPQGSTSPCITFGGPSGTGTASPNPVNQGDTTLLTVVTTLGTPAFSILNVVSDLTAIGGVNPQPFFDDGSHGDLTAGDRIYSYATTVAASTTVGIKSLPFTVTDTGFRSGGGVISLTVQAPPPPFVAIHTIQGPGAVSTYAGQAVLTEGVVTAVRFNNGFFLQTPDFEMDPDPNTSEGIFVFTSGPAPAAAAVGNLVEVIGTVQEFTPLDDPNSLPSTEIVGSVVRFIAADQGLPAPITLTAADTDPAGSIDQLERFEHMRVHVDSLTVIAPTQGTVLEASATSNSNGVFFGVLPGVQRPFREPGIQVPDPLPFEAPPTVPRFDTNPERLRIDSDGQVGVRIANRIDVATGATVTNVTGVLDYSSRSYTILPDPAPPPIASGVFSAVPVRAPAPNEFTIATANLERFFDTVDEPGIGDVALSIAAFNNRLSKLSLMIRQVMQTPDIIGVQEVENLATLQAIAAKVNADVVAAGDPNPHYEAYLIEGNDRGGIDVGFLLKTPRVTVIDMVQLGPEATYIDPTTNQPALLNDRPSLALRAVVADSGEVTTPVTVIVNHLRSLNGIDDPLDGPRVRAKRRAQAEFLAAEIQSCQIAGELIVSIGDYNAFGFSDGYVDVMGTIKGTPTSAELVTLASGDLVNPDLIDLAALLPLMPYSYVFDGSAQELDHILVSQNLLPLWSGLQWGRSNADFPEIFRNDPARPERLSDHDPLVAYFRMAEAGRIAGSGTLESDEFRYWFNLRAREGATTIQRGTLSIIVRDAHGRKLSTFEALVDSVIFFDDAPFDSGRPDRPTVDAVGISGSGTWNDVSGYTFVAEATDAGEPGHGRDRFAITIRAPGGAVVLSIDNVIASGNIQSTRMTH
jgi:hypothetical protein